MACRAAVPASTSVSATLRRAAPLEISEPIRWKLTRQSMHRISVAKRVHVIAGATTAVIQFYEASGSLTLRDEHYRSSDGDEWHGGETLSWARWRVDGSRR
jgi:hypothetical protein